MSNKVLIDTGFWFALYFPRDQYHEQALELFDLISINASILIPWPTLYETLNTRFVKQKDVMRKFEKVLYNSETLLVDDKYLKDNALEAIFSDRFIFTRPKVSLVDAYIREIIADESFKIDYLFTFNPDDFRDICAYRKITILPES